MERAAGDDGQNEGRREQLISVVRWLAAEPDGAIAAADGTIAADEIALDLSHWLEVARDWHLLDESVDSELRVIDEAFAAMTDAGPQLWTDEAIRSAPEWAEQRLRARSVLAQLSGPPGEERFARPAASGDIP